MIRVRNRSIAGPSGQAYSKRTNKKTGAVSYSYNFTDASFIARSETMEDIDKGDFKSPNPVIHNLITRSGFIASGESHRETTTDYLDSAAIAFPIDFVRITSPGATPTSTAPPPSELAATAIASSTPYSSPANLLVSIAELRDLPQTFRSLLGGREMSDWFSEIIKRKSVKRPPDPKFRKRDYTKVARSDNSVAAFDFGVLPLVRDIVNLFSTPKFIDDRIDRINNGNGALVEHRSVFSNSSDSRTNNVTLGTSNIGTIRATRLRTLSEGWRATVKWTPKDNIRSLSDQAMRDYVRNSALGLTPEQLLYGLWQALPWSWLIDWFSDFGKSLAITQSIFTWDYNCCLSHRLENVETFTITQKPDWVSVTNGRMTRRYWRRYTNVPPSVNLICPGPPKISAKQSLTLLGIAANMRNYPGGKT